MGGSPVPRSGATTNASKPSSMRTSRVLGVIRSSDDTSSTRCGTPLVNAATEGSWRLARGTWNPSAISSAIPRPNRPRIERRRSSANATSARS